MASISAVRASAGDQVLVIATSGHNTFADRIESARSGADVYFEKPIDMEVLCGRIQEVATSGRTAARILCVSDDSSHASRVRNALEPAGYELTVCENVEHFEAIWCVCPAGALARRMNTVKWSVVSIDGRGARAARQKILGRPVAGSAGN